MSGPPPAGEEARLRVAIYAADGSVVGVLTGVRATIEANTPEGGTWRALPDALRRAADVAPLKPTT